MEDETYFQVIAWTIDVLIISASIIFFYSFFRLEEKSCGVYMILILNISDLIFPIMNLLTKICVTNILTARIFAAFATFCYGFGLYWSTSIAFLIYSILKCRRILNLPVYMIYCFFLSFGVVLPSFMIVLFEAFGVDIELNTPGLFSLQYPMKDFGNQIVYYCIFDIVGRLIPLLTTFYCYFRVYLGLKKVYDINQAAPQRNRTRVLLYSFIQVTCFAPGMIADAVYMFQDLSYPLGLKLVISTLHRSWGFLNLLAYWFLRPREDERRHSMINSRTSNESSITVLSDF